ncbi:MAG: hypothetical protein MI922_00480 [Bacteroidales bacterium]|nr:hypothetical protein [Bacteroidales bacterium]
MNEQITLNQDLSEYISDYLLDFNEINTERKAILESLAKVVVENQSKEEVNLTFICTHNSRRSHISQIWAQAAAAYYGVDKIHCFSGGTEATAFNPRAVKAMKKAGFNITTADTNENPVYEVRYSSEANVLKAFSKKYEDPFNPQEGFIAVMTCNHADEACPIVFGADRRVAITYIDPKVSDNTPEEETTYENRSKQIGREMFYTFNKVKQLMNE